MDNKREQILTDIVTRCTTFSYIKKIRRMRPTRTEFAGISEMQIPMLAIEAPAPTPIKNVAEARKPFVNVVKFGYSLPVELSYYYKSNADEADTVFGTVYDDLHRKLLEEPLLSGLVDKVDIAPSEFTKPMLITDPYYVFVVMARIEYKTTQGI